MKKILTVAILFLLSVNIVTAKEKDNYRVKFDGVEYNLLYSTKNPELGGYLNEYYKWNETYNNWSEMVAIHHFPNAYSPIDQVKSFREYLGSLNCPSALTFDEDKNIALIDFIMINDHRLPIVLEFNVFKYEKSKKCGSVAVQYAKRYVVTTAFQMEAAKKDFDRIRKRALKQVKNFSVPEIVYKEIDKCKIEDEPKEIVPVNDIKKLEEPVLQEEITDDLENTTETQSEDNTATSPETEEQKEVIAVPNEASDELNETKINDNKESEEIIEITGNEKPAKEEIEEPDEKTLEAEEDIIEQKSEQQNNEPQDLTEDNIAPEKTEEKFEEEYREPEIAKPDDIKDNIKDIPDKTENTSEYSPIHIEEYTHSATYETTKVKSEKNIKPAKQKKQKKVSAKKRAKEAAKKLAQ